MVEDLKESVRELIEELKEYDGVFRKEINEAEEPFHHHRMKGAREVLKIVLEDLRELIGIRPGKDGVVILDGEKWPEVECIEVGVDTLSPGKGSPMDGGGDGGDLEIASSVLREALGDGFRVTFVPRKEVLATKVDSLDPGCSGSCPCFQNPKDEDDPDPIPERPDGAIQCRLCGGRGLLDSVQGEIPCVLCRGNGWIKRRVAGKHGEPPGREALRRHLPLTDSEAAALRKR